MEGSRAATCWAAAAAAKLGSFARARAMACCKVTGAATEPSCWAKAACRDRAKTMSESRGMRCGLLLPNDQDGKAAGDDCRPGTRVSRSRGWALAKGGGRQVEPAGLCVQCHGSGSALGGEGLQHRVGVFTRVDDSECAAAVRGEGQLARGIVASRVRAIADRRVGQGLAGVGIVHRHLASIAYREQPAAGRVDRQAGWRFTIVQRPVGGNGHQRRVEAVDFVLALDVGEDRAGAIRDRELWLTGEWDGDDGRALCCINYGYITAAAIESPDGFGYRLEDNSVRVRTGGNRGYGGQRGAVEDHHNIGAAVADVSILTGIVEG